ncbi:beta-ketoacyl-[acyl-carrier-protein] synthase family protein [Aurantibacter aestuarii]|uniref:Beta-ketoacyl-[acyl-carrier-protein] synthase family protein n=2 Tax=Aurantibacter aestuarii TaxID=1266046 RepID=A0A2T1NDF9_9FLAO|nr:beta-ketoacyl-[acyl-carrier-protein] synthase family protein [Aurantibacter aestuarii]
MGIISAIGHTVEDHRTSLMASKSGISTISNFKTAHANSIKVGEIKKTNLELSKALNLPENHNYTRTALLGCIAVKEALAQANISDVFNYKTGLISATTVGGMDKSELHFPDFNSSKNAEKYISSHHAGDSSNKIANYFNITEFVTTISTACSSATNAIMLGARLIRSGQLDRVIVGGTDPLCKFTINGFKSLMILSDEICAPFDANRKGLNLGEAGAFLILESERARQDKPVLAYVSGYGNANDAFHQTASSENGDGAFLAMQKALKLAKLQPEHIDYINAHGTATVNNDSSESAAIKRLFTQVPKFSSTKAFTGHTLATAGAVEAIISILAIQEQAVFPNLNFKNPIPELGLIPETKLVSAKINHVLSNSFGFGGNCSTLILSKA